MKFTNIVPLALCLLAVAADAASQSKEVVILKSAENETLSAAPIAGSPVILFANDSVILKNGPWVTSFPKSDIGSFEHSEELRSPFGVKVVTNDSLRYPLEGKFVTLHNELDDDLFGIIQKSDAEGMATFGNLPAGLYTVYVNDADGRFDPGLIYDVPHGYNEMIEIILDEKVTDPYLISYVIDDIGEGYHDIWLEWQTDFDTEGYTYIIYINGEFYGETRENHYHISRLPSGEYEIIVAARSEYGNESDEGRRFMIAIEGSGALGLENVEKEAAGHVPSFDLHGRPVTDPSSGIYIIGGKKVVVK